MNILNSHAKIYRYVPTYYLLVYIFLRTVQQSAIKNISSDVNSLSYSRISFEKSLISELWEVNEMEIEKRKRSVWEMNEGRFISIR